MPKTKAKKKLQDYYAVVKVEAIVHFKATSEVDANKEADYIGGNLICEMSDQVSKKYRNLEIDVNDFEVDEVEEHE